MPGACELRLLDRTPSQAAQCVAEWAASVLASVGRVVGSPASATLGDFLTSFVLAFCGLIAVVWLFAPDWQRSGHVGMGCRELACVPDRCPHYCVTLLRA